MRDADHAEHPFASRTLSASDNCIYAAPETGGRKIRKVFTLPLLTSLMQPSSCVNFGKGSCCINSDKNSLWHSLPSEKLRIPCSSSKAAKQEIFLARGLCWEAGVVASPQAPAQWTPIRMAAAGMALKAGYPHRQGPDVNPPEENFRGIPQLAFANSCDIVILLHLG